MKGENKMLKSKKGISLAVLIITIIVMVILTGVVVISIGDSGTIDMAKDAVNKTNMKQIESLVMMGWADGYMAGLRTQPELEEYVFDYLATNNVTVKGDFDVIVTTEGAQLKVIEKTEAPEAWTNVTRIVDGVPIPKGFVESPYRGESTKDGGLVIYELRTGETEIPETEAHQTSLTTRNQFVWVPVSEEEFKDYFKRRNFNTSFTLSNELGKGYWEVALDTTTNLPALTQEATQTHMSTATIAEVNAMYNSVKKYGGFYIGRYEAGVYSAMDAVTAIDGLTIYSVMGKYPCYFVTWGNGTSLANDEDGAVELARNLYPATSSSYGAASTLVYGVQWDTTVQWFLDSGAMASITDDKGVFLNTVVEAGDFNTNAKYAAGGSWNNATSTTTLDGTVQFHTTTGALKKAKINNIYDMAGNCWEFTMEGRDSGSVVRRGGSSGFDVETYTIGGRTGTGKESKTATKGNGFRVSLYIK